MEYQIFYSTTEVLPLFNGSVIDTDDKYNITDTLVKLYPPIFILCGTIGHLLSAVIWYKLLRGTVTGVFIVAFSVSNLVGLYLEPLVRTTYHWYEYDIRRIKDLCKTIYILDQVAAYCSVWFVFAFCLERSARLLQINGCERSRKKAILFTIFVTLLSFVLTCYTTFSVKTDIIEEKKVSLFETTSSLVCGVQTNDIFIPNTFFNFFWVQSLLYCVIPSTLIVGCTIATGQLLHAHKHGNINPCLKSGIPIKTSDIQLAKVAMVLGSVQIVCTVPVTIFKTQVALIQTSTEELIYTALIMLVHAEYTFKFIIYCTLNENFRKSIALLFRTGGVLRQLSIQRLRLLSRRKQSGTNIEMNMGLMIDSETLASSVEAAEAETSTEQMSSGKSFSGEKKFCFEQRPESSEAVVRLEVEQTTTVV